MENQQFSFNVSLTILNHLGRNLYRNFITILGEAISNSWDADAKEVYITIDKSNKSLTILDDGLGMTEDDFQNKFLKIGYSKRKHVFKTPSGRPFIGRKGIGKLALLSCSKKITIITKSIDSQITGGIIDNTELDVAIQDDNTEYTLNTLNSEIINKYQNMKHGTCIIFDDLDVGIINTIEYLKYQVALQFRFAFFDENFKIYINNDEVNENCLSKLVNVTQFIWTANNADVSTKYDIDNDNFVRLINKSFEKVDDNKKYGLTRDERYINIIPEPQHFKGFIASVEKPKQLNILGTGESVTLDLYVNGRLREKDILRNHRSAKIAESYLYGQIHCDMLDIGDNEDIFLSSREGVIQSDNQVKELIKEVRNTVKNIIENWKILRKKIGQEGDTSDIDTGKKYNEKIQEAVADYCKFLINDVNNDELTNKIRGILKSLQSHAGSNLESYLKCFTIENMIRVYINEQNIELTVEASHEIEKQRKRHIDAKTKAGVSINIRGSDDLSFLDMTSLSNLVDKAAKQNNDIRCLSEQAKEFKVYRDPLMHTSLLTNEACSALTSLENNIIARVKELYKTKLTV